MYSMSSGGGGSKHLDLVISLWPEADVEYMTLVMIWKFSLVSNRGSNIGDWFSCGTMNSDIFVFLLVPWLWHFTGNFLQQVHPCLCPWSPSHTQTHTFPCVNRLSEWSVLGSGLLSSTLSHAQVCSTIVDRISSCLSPFSLTASTSLFSPFLSESYNLNTKAATNLAPWTSPSSFCLSSTYNVPHLEH